MAPTSRIYLTRHAQAEHNVEMDWSIPDAPLTPLGRKQSRALSLALRPHHPTFDLIVSSPLKRTLQTTLLAYGPTISRLGGPSSVVCLPEAQECNDFPCDTGSSREELEAMPEFAGLDLGPLTPEWNSKQGKWGAGRRELRERAAEVRRFLRGRKEREIVLVAHGDILRQITATGEEAGTYMWKNAEMRIYTFDPATVDTEDCFLRLTEIVEATGGWAPTSTDVDLPDHETNGKI